MRILYLLWSYPQISETYVHSEIKYLKDKHEIEVIALRPPDIACESPVPHQVIPVNEIERIEQAARDFAPDIVHGHWIFLAPLYDHISRTLGVPFTVRSHGFDVLNRQTEKFRAECALMNQDSCRGVLVMPYGYDLMKAGGSDGDKIIKSSPVVDVSIFDGEAPNGAAIMNTGACTPKKNMEDFLRLGAANRDLEFNLYALGYDVPKIQAENERLGSPVNLRDPVPHAEMPSVYKKHGWLVYTANLERRTVGWPMAVTEAMASGCGVAIPKVREDLTEYIGDAGYFYDDILELSDLIHRPVAEDRRQEGIRLAKRHDITSQLHLLEDLWVDPGSARVEPATDRTRDAARRTSLER